MMTFQPRYALQGTAFCELFWLTPLDLKPLAPANGAPADATRDPLLRDKVHGQEILQVRKALAFAGFTHKSPRFVSYVRADKAFDPEPNSYGHEEHHRGRSTLRGPRDAGRSRAISM
jgi:protein-serine/threonine kinase